MDSFTAVLTTLFRDGLYMYRSPLCTYRTVQKYRTYVRYIWSGDTYNPYGAFK
jgi:hypothetical protein